MIRNAFATFPAGPLARVAAAAAAIAALAGCSSAPLSFIDDNQVYHRTVLNRYPVRVVAVDGASTSFRPVPISPGEHLLTLDAPPVAGFTVPTQKVYPLSVAPCTRYYVAAQRTSPLTQDWEFVVEQAFPVAGCDPRRELEKAKTTAISGLPASSAASSTTSSAPGDTTLR